MLECSIESLHRSRHWSRQRLSHLWAALSFVRVYFRLTCVSGLNALHSISDREEQTKGTCVLEVSMTSYKQSNKSLRINDWGEKSTRTEPFVQIHMCSSLEPMVLYKHPLISLICTSTLGIYQITQQGRGAFDYFFILLFTCFLFGNQVMWAILAHCRGFVSICDHWGIIIA